MYYPYLRGKQFELILLRDNAEFLADNRIHPIIEPVRGDFNALKRTLKALCEKKAFCTVIVNPIAGDPPLKQSVILSNIFSNCPDKEYISLGYVLSANSRLEDLESLLDEYSDTTFSILHYGFTNGIKASEILKNYDLVRRHIFIDGFAGKLYQSYLKNRGIERVLIRDGFKPQKRNSLYPRSEHFSDLHITFPDEGMDGFGDFLMVGEDYTESGGPAYAIAIHLTYIEEDGDMFIFHFLSDQTDSPINPGGKFFEALAKLITELHKPKSLIYKSLASGEFQNLYRSKHYPGLGYIKKLSMQHHIELMADFLMKNR